MPIDNKPNNNEANPNGNGPDPGNPNPTNQQEQSESANQDSSDWKRWIPNWNTLVPFEKWQVVLASIGAVLAFGGLLILSGQNEILLRQSEIMERQNDLISGELAAIQEQTRAMQDQLTAFERSMAQTDALIEQGGIEARATTDAADAAVESNRITRDAFRADQRAWVGQSGAIRPSQSDLEKGGGNFIFGVGLANSGRTPALELHSSTTSRFRRAGIEPDFTFSDASANSIESSGALFPGGGSNAIALPVSMSLPVIESIKKGELVFYVYGNVRYKDVFGRPHTTTWCIFLRPDLNRMGICNRYNSAD